MNYLTRPRLISPVCSDSGRPEGGGQVAVGECWRREERAGEGSESDRQERGELRWRPGAEDRHLHRRHREREAAHALHLPEP